MDGGRIASGNIAGMVAVALAVGDCAKRYVKVPFATR